MKRSVAGIAFERDALFIARRKAGGDLGGKWEFPGGKAEEGEDDSSALRREYAEEFAVNVTIGSFLAGAEFTHGGRPFSLSAYRVFFDVQNLRLNEHEEWRWASFDEIAALDFADSDRLLLPALQTYVQTRRGINNG